MRALLEYPIPLWMFPAAWLALNIFRVVRKKWGGYESGSWLCVECWRLRFKYRYRVWRIHG